MGRTYINSRDYDEWDRPQKIKSKSSKHSRNLPGKGMRVINSLSEDDYDNYEDYDDQYYDEYYDDKSTTKR